MIASRAFPLFFRWLVRLSCCPATSCFRLDSVCFCGLCRSLIYGLFRCLFRFIAASFLLTPIAYAFMPNCPVCVPACIFVRPCCVQFL